MSLRGPPSTSLSLRSLVGNLISPDPTVPDVTLHSWWSLQHSMSHSLPRARQESDPVDCKSGKYDRCARSFCKELQQVCLEKV